MIWGLSFLTKDSLEMVIAAGRLSEDQIASQQVPRTLGTRDMKQRMEKLTGIEYSRKLRMTWRRGLFTLGC